MKKRILSFLLALVMVLSLVPTVAFATEGNVAKIDETEYTTLGAAVSATVDGDKTIVLLADCASVDFNSAALTLDLNGFKLTGASTNATGVTIANSGAKKTTLEATGVYANDCSEFAADGYAAVDNDKTAPGNDGKEVIDNTKPGTFTVKVVTSIDDDRATTRTDATAAPNEEGYVNEQDVYAGDTVYVEVRVYGARFVGADVRLGYDTAKFDMTDKPVSGWNDGDDEDSDEDATGFVRFQAAKSTQGGASAYYNLNKVDENGEYYYSLGKFEFEAKTCTEDTFDIPFTVKTEGSVTHTKNTYVAGAWSEGWSSSPANALDVNHLVNARVNIRMVKMTVNISAMDNLTYDTSAKNLVNSTYSVVDTLRDNDPILGTTVKFILQTKEQAEGVQAKDSFGDLLYYEDDGSGNATTTETTTKTNHPKYTTEPTPRGNGWDTAWPTAADAGDYVIYYQVSKTGYATVEGKLENTIKKKEIDLTWTNGGFTKGTKTGDGLAPHQYYTEYATGGEGTAKTMPAASFIDGSNTTQNATITVTKKDGAAVTGITELKDVAVYELTATLDSAIANNYVVKNPTVNVLIDGSQITGYSLANADNEGAEKWYDAQNHTPAKLVEEAGKTEGVTIKYTVLKDGVPMVGKTDIDAIPADLTEVGTYTVQATLTKTGFYDKALTPVTFTIKSVEFKVEKVDWVTGWDVVFVYTDTAGVHFTYDDKEMFDMSSLTVNSEKYKFENTTEYNYVYGIAVYGDADTTKVVSSNGSVKSIRNTQNSVVDARCNINNTAPGSTDKPERKGVDLNDLVACQAIYNVSEEYLKTKNTGTTEAPILTEDVEDAKMVIVLKADVNGDKKVDTNDCAQIKVNSENN